MIIAIPAMPRKVEKMKNETKKKLGRAVEFVVECLVWLLGRRRRL
jgi:hypothetical protein